MNLKSKHIILIGCLIMAATVAIGAFGAHGLRDFLTKNNRLATFDTAVEYQFLHAIGIIISGILSRSFPKNKKIRTSVLFFLAGIMLFSGSLYVLCLTQLSLMGTVAPIGGLSFIIGWFILGFGVLKSNGHSN